MHGTRWLFVVAVLNAVMVSPAAAQATRTWVSGVGDDANPCSRTAPCKTFAGAISKTAAGGEIDALDPGDFGAVTITKSITLDGRGTFAGAGTITVNAGTAVVVLRGLSIRPSATTTGIAFTAGAALHVEDCSIGGFTTSGIEFAPSAGGQLIVKEAALRENPGTGIHVASSATATIEKSDVSGSTVGLDAGGTAKVSIHDSVFAGNGTGVQAGVTAEVNVDHGLIANNGVGVQANSTVRLSEVMVSGNATGVTGNVVSFGNNRIAAGNGANGTPASTVPQE
jgi:Right handed beta helix region